MEGSGKSSLPLLAGLSDARAVPPTEPPAAPSTALSTSEQPAQASVQRFVDGSSSSGEVVHIVAVTCGLRTAQSALMMIRVDPLPPTSHSRMN